jgi:hypothetical protein
MKMNLKKIQLGSRVHVPSKIKRSWDRTGVIVAKKGTSINGNQKQWMVRFDWPLGGMESYAEVAEGDMDLLYNIPNK